MVNVVMVDVISTLTFNAEGADVIDLDVIYAFDFFAIQNFCIDCVYFATQSDVNGTI